jgi:hypothetical protein
VNLFFMPRFNAEGNADNRNALALTLRDRNDKRRKSENQYHQTNPKQRFHLKAAKKVPR